MFEIYSKMYFQWQKVCLRLKNNLSNWISIIEQDMERDSYLKGLEV